MKYRNNIHLTNAIKNKFIYIISFIIYVLVVILGVSISGVVQGRSLPHNLDFYVKVLHMTYPTDAPNISMYPSLLFFVLQYMAWFTSQWIMLWTQIPDNVHPLSPIIQRSQWRALIIEAFLLGLCLLHIAKHLITMAGKGH